MAHTCPDCGLMCYCGGDIDDCCFDATPEQDACMHCFDADFDGDDFDDLVDDETDEEDDGEPDPDEGEYERMKDNRLEEMDADGYRDVP